MRGDDPYRYFRVEARELADALAHGVMELEGRADPGEVLARLLRQAHTLKGAARVVGHRDLAERAHGLEDALVAVRDTGRPAGRADVERLLALVDGIAAQVRALEAPPSVAPAPAAPPGEETTRVELADLDALLELAAEVASRGEALRGAVARLLAQPGARAEPSGASAAARVARDLDAHVAAMETDAERLAVRLHALRLMPADAIFTQLERAARDAAALLDKRVAFSAAGGETRVDRRVLSLVRDGLVQVVRNAIDHGIEPPDERVAAGKPPGGRVDVRVERRGERAEFTCRDDGRGIDPAAVRAAAERAGLDVAGSDEAALRLVLQPGVSTSPRVGAVSGRGVGLDVLRSIAEQLKGEVDVSSEPGRGTTVTIRVPVSVSALPALLVEAGEMPASLPLDAVRRMLRVEAREVAPRGDGEAVVVDGVAIPLVRLGPLVGGGAGDPARAQPVAVVETRGGTVAIGVDRVLGAAHVVLRPMPPEAGDLPSLGASFDADGTPRPMLDPAALLDARFLRGRPPPVAARRRARVLVIDDSLTTRMLEQSILSSAGYDVDVASSGEQGLDMARAGSYDLFIVDVQMPGIDGFDFVARTRADAALRSVPAIIVSSRASDADRRRGKEVGASAYVVKSEFAQGAFLDLVRGLCG